MADAWRSALDAAEVEWCNGKGCTSGSRDQHLAGFTTAERVHLTFPPDPDDREATHAALRLVGLVAARRDAEPGTPQRTLVVEAFDFATERMRAAKMSVPKAVTALRPSETPILGGTVDAPAAPEPVEAQDAVLEPEGDDG